MHEYSTYAQTQTNTVTYSIASFVYRAHDKSSKRNHAHNPEIRVSLYHKYLNNGGYIRRSTRHTVINCWNEGSDMQLTRPKCFNQYRPTGHSLTAAEHTTNTANSLPINAMVTCEIK